MIKMKFIYTIIILLMLCSFVSGQADYPYLRSADKLFVDGKLSDAETSYRKALELNPKPGTSYNLANSMFLQDRIPEAIEEYKKSIKSADNQDVKARAHYNMGNAYFQNKEYDQSILAYKESLKLNPDDIDAKKNLMLAMRHLKQQQKLQNQQNQSEQEQKQEEQQQKEQQQQQQQQQEQQQKEKEQQEEVSKEEASEILKAIEREDQRVQEKLKKSTGKSTPPVKDW